jgi:hypothetical protein
MYSIKHNVIIVATSFTYSNIRVTYLFVELMLPVILYSVSISIIWGVLQQSEHVTLLLKKLA